MSEEKNQSYFGFLLEIVELGLCILLIYWLCIAGENAEINNTPYFKELGNSVRLTIDQFKSGYNNELKSDTFYHIYNYEVSRNGDTILMSERHFKSNLTTDSIK